MMSKSGEPHMAYEVAFHKSTFLQECHVQWHLTRSVAVARYARSDHSLMAIAVHMHNHILLTPLNTQLCCRATTTKFTPE